jgi:uncharacterized NAD-dependent epimerase/dehydratase family protein
MTVGLELRKPYLIFVGGATSNSYAKTAFGLRDWAPEACLAQCSLEGSTVDLGLPRMSPEQAAAAGARSILIGVAPTGGRIEPAWEEVLLRAARSGLDVISGLHTPLANVPGLSEAALKYGVTLHDVRRPRRSFPVASGDRRSGKRLATVGTDCALGKKYTALALTKALKSRGVPADFRATGQTGIMISGSGVAVDSIVADFVAGAAETLSPGAAPDHWDVIEGQGSLFHPGYAAVTLGLLHGSQPDVLILCHDPLRAHIKEYPNFPLPPLDVAAQLYLQLARLTNPAVRLAGVSLNTFQLDEAQRREVLAQTEALLKVPAFDPMKSPLDAVLDRVLSP